MKRKVLIKRLLHELNFRRRYLDCYIFNHIMISQEKILFSPSFYKKSKDIQQKILDECRKELLEYIEKTCESYQNEKN